MRTQRSRGSVMVPVVLAMTLVGAVVLLMVTRAGERGVMAARAVDAEQARLLASSAVAHAASALDQGGSCTGYVPGTASAAFGDYSFSVSPAAGSPVRIEGVGTTSDGARATVVRAEHVVRQSPLSVVVQPDADTGKDAWLTSVQPTENYGASPTLSVQSGQHAVLSFDLRSVPPWAKVVAARLTLRADSVATPGQVSVRALTRAWDEGTCNGAGCTANGATWNKATAFTNWTTTGGDVETDVAAATAVTAAGSAYSFDITSLVQRWRSGTLANNGLRLEAAAGGAMTFASSDAGTATDRPRLDVTYACACGEACAAPMGDGGVVLVVRSLSLSPDDQLRLSTMQAWGYNVTVLADYYFATVFNTSMAVNDVAYVTPRVDPAQLGSKLTATGKGVVIENGNLLSTFGIGGSASYAIDSSLAVTDNTHFVTTPFALGALPIHDADMEGMSFGAAASGVTPLADFSGATLGVVEAGGTLVGGTASGRRVVMPFGRADRHNWAHLGANGQLLVQRAIQWAGSTDSSCRTFADEFGVVSWENNDGTQNWSAAWQETDSGGAGPGAGDAKITGGSFELRIAGKSIQRGADLSQFGSATLAFDYMLDWGIDVGSDRAVVEVDAGSGFVPLEEFSGLGGGASGTRTFDISSHISSNTRIRIRILEGYSGTNEKVFIGRISISACGDATGPVAHWKLDDGTGLVAVDSAGGHDGALSGGAWTADGQVDGALVFDGNDSIAVPHDDALTLTTSFTLAAWVRAASGGLGYYNIVLSKGSGSSNVNYWLAVNGGQLNTGFYYAGTGTFTEFETTGSALQINTWYHLAVTFDGAADSIRLYRNGVEVLSQSTTAVPPTTSGTLYIGRSQFAGDDQWLGRLDDVRIYWTALPASEVLALYESGAALVAGGGGESGTDPDTDIGAGCTATVADDFQSGGYAGSSGSLVWQAAWAEFGDDGVPNGGDERVGPSDAANRYARVGDNDGGGEGIVRVADTSSYTTATLSFGYWRDGLDGASDYAAVQVSTDGSNWTELQRFAGPGTDSAFTTVSHDITSFIGPTTHVRFVTSPEMGGADYVRFDNVLIELSGCAG